jgi:hypothetical protein
MLVETRGFLPGDERKEMGMNVDSQCHFLRLQHSSFCVLRFVVHAALITLEGA